MIFHRGRCPKTSFQYNGQELEIVKSFTYLGFIFTVQLSFTKHLEAQIVKARSRVGQLFVRLPLMDLPLDLVLKTFAVYVIPIFLYGLPMWLNACSKSAICSMDAIFTKYLKRYVHLPPWANNATLYFITETIPLSKYLKNRAPHTTSGLVFPECMSGLKLSFLNFKSDHSEFTTFDPVPDIPSSFWLSKTFATIPTNSFYRRKIIREVFDMNHREICKTTTFHKASDLTCICSQCGEHAHNYHERFCTVNNH